MQLIFQLSSIVLLLLINFQISKTDQGNSRYCDISSKICPGHEKHHLKCECESHDGCELAEVNDDFRKRVLKAHNEKRNEIALGQHAEFVENVANMMAISYRVDLERLAECNVLQCDMVHDTCRAIFSEGYDKPAVPFGQNLYYEMNKFKGNLDEIETAVQRWFDEIKDYPPKNQLYEKVEKTGHYTQLIWATSKYVGCAIAANKRKGTHYLGCNYLPAGNWKRHDIYKPGAACSECEDNIKCNKKYTGLCGEITIDKSLSTKIFVDLTLLCLPLFIIQFI